MCQIPTRFPCLVNIFLTHKHAKSIHVGELHSWKKAGECALNRDSLCLPFLFPSLLYSTGASDHILGFHQSISNFLNDIFSFLRDRQWNQKMSYIGEDNGGYSFRAISAQFHFFWWRNEFQWFISSEPCLCKCISWDGLNWPKTNVGRVRN